MAGGSLIVLLIICFASHRAESKEAAQKTPVLVELFTSEGCSSCPPADSLLIRLEELQPVAGARIIVLSQHVDYWNRLGWADPYSSALFSRRQNEYADAFGSRGVYTPQMIVDGQEELVGSDASRAQQAIARAAARAKLPVVVTFTAEAKSDRGRIHIEVGRGAGDSLPGDAEAFLAITESNISTDVPRGENTGRTLRHTGVVRTLKSLGPLTPSQTFEEDVRLPAAWQRKNLSAVVFLQEKRSRQIRGAELAMLTER